MIVPVFLLMLLGMLEFGFAFDHSSTVGNATREGARMGSSLVNGGGTLGCPSSATVSPNAATVDGRIVAAVQRILAAPGSRVVLSDVAEIRIYKATSTGTETAGKVNVWTYSVDPDGDRRRERQLRPVRRPTVDPLFKVVSVDELRFTPGRPAAVPAGFDRRGRQVHVPACHPARGSDGVLRRQRQLVDRASPSGRSWP